MFPWDSPCTISPNETFRQYVYRRKTEGASYQQIADEVGCTYASCRMILRNQFRGRIPGEGAELQQTVPAVPSEILQLRREIATLTRENRKLKDTQSIIRASIHEAVQPIPAAPLLPCPPPSASKTKHKPHIVQALLGDIQWGTFINPDDTGGLSEVNLDAFRDRAQKWVDGILTITEIHRNAYPVEVLEVVGLGDYVEGESIYLGQPHHIDQPVLEQIFVGSKVIADALNQLLTRGRFKTVRTRWLAGNHGMPGGRKGGSHPKTNWDYVFAHDVEARCSLLPIEFIISASNFAAWRIPESPKHIHLATHGDQIPSSFSIPYYGVDRAVRSYAALTGLPVDYFYVAHHHRRASVDTPRGKWIMNGNWVGGSVLAVARMMTGGEASQTLCLLHPERGIVAEYPVILWEMPEMSENRYGDGLFTPAMESFALEQP